MTTNERELAQLERAEQKEEVELALVVIEVAGRDEQGRVTQYRRMHEATDAEVKAILKKRREAQRGPAS